MRIATLKVRVQAGARRERILGMMGDLLRVAVQAPALEGAANRALVRYLARSFGTSRSSVRVLRGEKSKVKTIEFADLTSEELKRRLQELIETSTKTREPNDE